MKTQITSGLGIYSATMDQTNTLMYILEFDRILATCLRLDTEKDLREYFFKKEYRYFLIYFGGHHLAVIDKGTKERILFIEFDNQ